jgi:ectoine hydroxylase
MLLNEEQVAEYGDAGYLVVPGLFDKGEIAILKDAYHRDSQISGQHRINEADGDDVVRAVYASHQRQPEFAAVVRSPRLLGPTRQLLADDVYVYQFKINAKQAFCGGGWSWHQDYIAWQLMDGLPTSNIINAALFLDDVTEFNGPIVFVPGSHRQGLVRDDRNQGGSVSVHHLDPDDIELSPEQMADLISEHGIESAKGIAGSVVFFDSEIVHGSGSNISPFQRRILIISYNAVGNSPPSRREARPEYLVGRDTTPLRLTED